MNVRFLSEYDYTQYMTLINEFRPTSLSFSEFQDVLNDISKVGDIYLMVDEKTLEILATATLIYERKVIHNGGCVAHIEDVVVRSDQRGSGIGRNLVRYLVAEAQKKTGCYKVVLDCSPELEKFYQNLGFFRKNFQMEIRDSVF
jgi:glucosamine-phosphate N-acetyltransferase